MSTKDYFIAGAHGDIEDNDTAKYHLVLTTDTGKTIYSCEQSLNIKNTQQLKLFPNPVNSNRIFNIVFDLDISEFDHASLEVYSIIGQKVLSTNLPYRENTIHLPIGIQAGKYIAVIFINGQKKTINFIVK